LRKNELKVIRCRSRGTRYPAMNLLLRLSMKLGLLKASQAFYLRHKVLRKLGGIGF